MEKLCKFFIYLVNFVMVKDTYLLTYVHLGCCSSPRSASAMSSNVTTFNVTTGLQVTMKCNLRIVGYLDIIRNLTNFTYRPFTQANNEIN